VVFGGDRSTAVLKIRVRAITVDIHVDNGVVALGGFVEDDLQRQRAIKAASRVPGVQNCH
jgi:osmotically-inducible protein OsmY